MKKSASKWACVVPTKGARVNYSLIRAFTLLCSQLSTFNMETEK